MTSRPNPDREKNEATSEVRGNFFDIAIVVARKIRVPHILSFFLLLMVSAGIFFLLINAIFKTPEDASALVYFETLQTFILIGMGILVGITVANKYLND